jgi:hypothetical protein
MSRQKTEIEKIVDKRMLTTTVGILSMIEEQLGHLWGEQKPEGEELTEEEAKVDQLYEGLRSNIFDYGHIQRRRLFKEIQSYIDSENEKLKGNKDVK